MTHAPASSQGVRGVTRLAEHHAVQLASRPRDGPRRELVAGFGSASQVRANALTVGESLRPYAATPYLRCAPATPRSASASYLARKVPPEGRFPSGVRLPLRDLDATPISTSGPACNTCRTRPVSGRRRLVDAFGSPKWKTVTVTTRMTLPVGVGW